MEVMQVKLNRRQRLYVEGLGAGKSKRQAALDAGYSIGSANNAAFNIERRGRGGNPSVRRALALMARKAGREEVQ
jgi:hypothetical protein